MATSNEEEMARPLRESQKSELDCFESVSFRWLHDFRGSTRICERRPRHPGAVGMHLTFGAHRGAEERGRERALAAIVHRRQKPEACALLLASSFHARDFERKYSRCLAVVGSSSARRYRCSSAGRSGSTTSSSRLYQHTAEETALTRLSFGRRRRRHRRLCRQSCL